MQDTNVYKRGGYGTKVNDIHDKPFQSHEAIESIIYIPTSLTFAKCTSATSNLLESLKHNTWGP